jgi:hypothetical protein
VEVPGLGTVENEVIYEESEAKVSDEHSCTFMEVPELGTMVVSDENS